MRDAIILAIFVVGALGALALGSHDIAFGFACGGAGYMSRQVPPSSASSPRTPTPPQGTPHRKPPDKPQE